MFRWNKAKPKKKKTAHVRKEPPKPYTPPEIPKFTKQSEKPSPKKKNEFLPKKRSWTLSDSSQAAIGLLIFGETSW